MENEKNENQNTNSDDLDKAFDDFLKALKNLPEDQIDIFYNNLKNSDQNNNK